MKAIIKETGQIISAENAKKIYQDKGVYSDNMYMCTDEDCKQDLILAAKEPDSIVSCYFRAKNNHSQECSFYSEIDNKIKNHKSGITITYGSKENNNHTTRDKKAESNYQKNTYEAMSASIKRLFLKHDKEYYSILKLLVSDSNIMFRDNTTAEKDILLNKYFIPVKSINYIYESLSNFRIFYGIVKFWHGNNKTYGEYVKLSFIDPFMRKESVNIYINSKSFSDEFEYLKNLYKKQTKHNPKSTPSIGVFVRAMLDKESTINKSKVNIKNISDIWITSLRKVK